MELDDTHKKNKRMRTSLILAAWIVFTLIVAILGYPKVRRSVEESGVLAILQQSVGGQETTAQETRSVSVAFVTAGGDLSMFKVRGKRWGGSQYHDTFEALLSGPNQQVLASGAVSYIHPKTELVGLTVREKILFVELTKDFLQSIDPKKATEQLKATARSFENITDIVIIIDGEIWSEQ
ncbi:MAG: GerMN domain-containing protein [Sphaerochaeta sp.]